MDLPALRFLNTFNIWANRRLFDAVTDQHDEVRSNTHEIVAHIVSAEWIWMERLSGVSPSEVPDWVDDGKLPFLRNLLHEVEERRTSMLADLEPSEVSREVEYRRLNGTAGKAEVWRVVLHVFNHSTYHRGQLARSLREEGITPPSTDLIFFEPERSS